MNRQVAGGTRVPPLGLGIATLFALTVLVSGAAQQPAPEALFFMLPADAAAMTAVTVPRSRAVVDRRVVGLRLDRLFGPANRRVLLNLPERALAASIERLDIDRTGHRTWVGAIEGIRHSHVAITERAGVVSGLITTPGVSYQLRTRAPGTYVLDQIDPSRLPGELDPKVAAAGATRAEGPAAAATDGARDDGTVIDVVLLYTPAARAAAGGQAHIEAIGAQTISDSNTIFARSGIVPRLRLLGLAEHALVEAADMLVDLYTLTSSPTARTIRELARADLVQLLVSSPDLSTCGVAWLLGSLEDASFDAYSVADIACVAAYTPSHELAHNMGSHHAPDDGAFGALFPHSYGYKDAGRGFRTVMAYACAGGVSCPRIPNFSNPLVVHQGGATGAALQDNARSINEAAFTVANFRQALTPPAPPVGLTTEVNGSVVTARWSASGDAARAPSTGYILQLGSAPGFSDYFNAPIGHVAAMSGVVGPGTYYWRVRATNLAGASAPSAEAQFVVGGCLSPGPPESFTFARDGRTVFLSWLTPASGGAPATYIIEAGSASGLANLASAPIGAAVPAAVVVDAPPGAYYVRVRAQNACGTSGVSNEQVIVMP